MCSDKSTCQILIQIRSKNIRDLWLLQEWIRKQSVARYVVSEFEQLLTVRPYFQHEQFAPQSPSAPAAYRASSVVSNSTPRASPFQPFSPPQHSSFFSLVSSNGDGAIFEAMLHLGIFAFPHANVHILLNKKWNNLVQVK